MKKINTVFFLTGISVLFNFYCAYKNNAAGYGKVRLEDQQKKKQKEQKKEEEQKQKKEDDFLIKKYENPQQNVPQEFFLKGIFHCVNCKERERRMEKQEERINELGDREYELQNLIIKQKNLLEELKNYSLEILEKLEQYEYEKQLKKNDSLWNKIFGCCLKRKKIQKTKPSIF
jgi:hypothetical protein